MKNQEITLAEVRKELARGNRVLLMVRHAERPKMDHNDPSFGMTLPITEAGMQMSYDFGAALRGSAAEVQFMSSPLLRTRMTAEWIAKGMGLDGAPVAADDFLGNSTPYFADQYAVFELFRDGSFFEKIFAYFATGRQIGFHEVHEATERLDSWCVQHFTGDLGIFATHDLYIAAFLFAKGVVEKFSRDNWTRFLDSAAIIFKPDGTREYRFVRANLSDGIVGV